MGRQQLWEFTALQPTLQALKEFLYRSGEVSKYMALSMALTNDADGCPLLDFLI